MADHNSITPDAAAMELFTELADGTMIKLFAVGTRIRSKFHPRLTGRIKCIEMHESGKPSIIPYNIEWSNNDLAFEVFGWYWIYATHGSIEAIEED